MDISLSKDGQFKIKGRTGILYPVENGVKIESASDGSSKELFGPGEYESCGISVIAVKNDDKVVFVYEVDGLRVCNFAKQIDTLPEGKISQVGDIDVLLAPVCAKSVEIMQQVEGYFTIPFDYKSEEELEKFLKESGVTVVRTAKFSLKKEEIVEDQMSQIVVLEAK